MEQNNSNYNRGGYGSGNSHGGRNNGGRGHSSGGVQAGGRGDNGRGTDGGYYRRGGRNRNYPQRYSNQQQELYGDGRDHRVSGAGAGGGGGGQPISRTPTYQTQNWGRVPDRFGANQEAKAWSRVVSGSSQPVQSPTPQIDLSDLQIQEVPVSSSKDIVQHSKNDTENGYVPIKRPDQGTLAVRSVSLLVNHFPVKYDPSNSILRYDVDVKLENTSSDRSVKKSIPKSDLRLIHEKLCSDYPDQFPLLKTAYDGEKNIFSAILLRAGTYNVQLFGKSYICTIKYVSELKLSKLQDFLDQKAFQIPRDVLQALDVVMKANLFREKVSVGRGMYPRVHRSEDDLRCGVAAIKGIQQSLKMTSNGLIMCSDYSVIPFRKRMPVLEFLKEHIREIQVVNDIGRFRNKVMCALKGLRIGVTHRRTNQKYIVSGLTEKLTNAISFELEDLEGKKEPEIVTLTDYFRGLRLYFTLSRLLVVVYHGITDYFRDRWEKEIVHKGIPCLKLGNGKKPNHVPMEFCVLAEDRRFPKEQLGREAARQLKDLCLLPPDSRRNEICSMMCEEYGTGSHGLEVIQNFEVGVGMNMTSVDGRVLPPPRLKLGGPGGKTITITVDRQKCHWNLQGKTLVDGKSLERWALIDFNSADRRNRLNVNMFIGKLMNRCRSLGVHMADPLVVHQTNMKEFLDVGRIRRLLSGIVEESRRIANGRLQMIVCVMAANDDGYKRLKFVSETEIGVMTQCCLSIHANTASDQFLANLGMKINAKLGGSNVELIERFPLFSGNDHCMFIGADVNHPAASNKSSPSIAAVVGSINWHAATRYAARVSPQSHCKEEIVDFGKMCLDLVNTYARENGVKPNRIVVFRDGVSDGQFDMVLNKEMVDMKKAFSDEHYRPFVTFVVAQKRHTTRLFLTPDGRESGNVPPGTVVDTTITHPSEFDFYLCSHFGGIGTSKPTHYSVIWNENGFSSDEMQKLIYYLCYISARCTKPVSLVPPVYYADLVAYRGRMFEEVVMELESGGSSSFDQSSYNLEPHLKDSMFFL